jgi:hypothetical protein
MRHQTLENGLALMPLGSSRPPLCSDALKVAVGLQPTDRPRPSPTASRQRRLNLHSVRAARRLAPVPSQASLTRRDPIRRPVPWAEAARLPSSYRDAMNTKGARKTEEGRPC